MVLSRKVFYPLLLLVLPFIGMKLSDEVNWSVYDFIVMGVLLILAGIGINFIVNKTKNSKYRFLYIAFLVLAFLLVWAELAVGIFGSPFAGT
jgi:bacteriorhodopsin